METVDTVRVVTRRPVWRKAWNLLQFAFTLAWTAGGIVVAVALLKLTGSPRGPLRMASNMWAPGLMIGAGAKLDVQGAEHVDWTRAHLIVSNHQSVIDICSLFIAVPVPLRFLLKQEMTRMPFVGWYAKATGMLFIDRDNPRAAPAMLKAAAAMLSEGWQLCVFPEGTRSRDGVVGEFKSGPFQAAIRAGVDVLPVSLDGARQVLPSDGFAVNPGPIKVRFGTPITTTGEHAIRDRNALAQAAHAQVDALLANGGRV
ncbi:lysophospholipid acyltransferase family protein [Solilutibacter silvestris]|nr:lysophospholipid acyltransferase family protein [Lysobacter silvestris]